MPLDPNEIKELLTRAKRRDEAAFSALVSAYERSVYTVAYHMTQSREDALDVSQEVFLKLWRALPTLREEGAFRTWLLQLTKNTALDLLRGRKKNAALSLTSEEDDEKTHDLPDPDPLSDPRTAYERREKIEAVRRAIDALPPDGRQVLVLRDMEGLSYEEIARLLELEIGTVKSRLHRARKNLRELLQTWNFS